MISGIDLKATIDYTLPSDKDNPTVWKLGIIPSMLFMKMSEQMQDSGIDAAYKFLQVALKGWDNFNVPYSTVKENIYGRDMDVVPVELLERIPAVNVMELFQKILEINKISLPERKN